MSNRRNFMMSAVASGAIANVAKAQDATAEGVISVGVMGLSRGQSLAKDFAAMPGIHVKYLCDVDTQRAANVAKQLQTLTEKEHLIEPDFRNLLADSELDVLVCAAPNHWHGPATIMACKAGKHVYVEKPCSHNPLEGEWMIQAAKEYGRVVQMGTQRRSAAGTREVMERLHAGEIGKLHLARCYYSNLRGPVGVGKPSKPPEHINYELWQGPAPRKPYLTQRLHYHWHWFWHWGGGELANNGVHALDLCRWGLGVDYPIRTTSSGGRYWYDDDQETPDVQSACFEFEDKKLITWDAVSCNKHGPGFICKFYGDKGALELESDGTFRQYDRNDKLTYEGTKSAVGQKEHIENFVTAVRANDASLLNQPIQEGHKSTLLCHLGNIAYRSGRTVSTNPKNGHIVRDEEQARLWRREYDPQWETDVSMG